MDVLTIAKFAILPLALGAVAVVLILGLTNLARGGSPQRSQKLMQWRVGLQAVALVFVLLTIFLMHRG
ncbi:MAG TPA: twin transmembrane helix small protein [Ancylobacter sp.]